MPLPFTCTDTLHTKPFRIHFLLLLILLNSSLHSLSFSLSLSQTFRYGLPNLVHALLDALGTVCLHVFVRHGLFTVRRYDETISIRIVTNKSWVLGFQAIGSYTFIRPLQVCCFYLYLRTSIVSEWNKIFAYLGCILSLHWILNAIVYCAKCTKFMLKVFHQFDNVVNISNWIAID